MSWNHGALGIERRAFSFRAPVEVVNIATKLAETAEARQQLQALYSGNAEIFKTVHSSALQTCHVRYGMNMAVQYSREHQALVMGQNPHSKAMGRSKKAPLCGMSRPHCRDSESATYLRSHKYKFPNNCCCFDLWLDDHLCLAGRPQLVRLALRGPCFYAYCCLSLFCSAAFCCR